MQPGILPDISLYQDGREVLTITILSLTYFRFFTLLSLEINWSVKKCASILNKLIYGKVKKLNSINILYFKFYEKFKGKKNKRKMADRRNAENYGSIQPNFYYVITSLFSFPNMVVKQTKFTSVIVLKYSSL